MDQAGYDRDGGNASIALLYQKGLTSYSNDSIIYYINTKRAVHETVI